MPGKRPPKRSEPSFPGFVIPVIIQTMKQKNSRRTRPPQAFAATIDQDEAVLEEPVEHELAPAETEDVKASEAFVTPQQSAFDRRFHEARVLENDGDAAGAIALYRELMLENPGDIRVRNNLGCLYEKRGQPVQALEQFEAARTLDPDNVAVLLNIGGALASLGRFELAERDLRQAQKLDPSRSDVYLQIGIMYFKRGLYDSAEAELKHASDLDPANALAYYFRGEALNHLQRMDEALEALERAVELQPGNSRAYYIMGILFDKKGLPQQAMAMYKKSREAAAR